MKRALIDLTQAVVCSCIAGFATGFVEGFIAGWQGLPLVHWWEAPMSSSHYWSGWVLNLALFGVLMIPISLWRQRRECVRSPA